jgi:hypothetical protein
LVVASAIEFKSDIFGDVASRLAVNQLGNADYDELAIAMVVAGMA